MIFEEFTRRENPDFVGLRSEIAKRLRKGIDPAGAKFLADLFDPESKSPFQAVVLLRPSRRHEYELKAMEDFREFEDIYESEGQDIDRAIRKVQEPKYAGGLWWDRDKAYKYGRQYREYLEAMRG
jgi:hypothetical protein